MKILFLIHISMPTATFAQLCAHVETVSDSSATVFDLYQDVSMNAAGVDGSGIPVKKLITAEAFMNLFYDHGVFKMRDCCNNIAVLHNWIVEPSGTDISNASWHSNTPYDPSNCDLFSLIKEQWILDASHNCGLDLSFNWGPCSYMKMFSQLLSASNLCNWGCKICCALTAKELADVLNYEEYTNNGDVWPTGSVPRTPVQPVKLGDCLILSVAFTNANPCVDPIELRLHFLIGWIDDWNNSALSRSSPFFPSAGQWTALRVVLMPPFPPIIMVAPTPSLTNQILIHTTNCLGLSTQIPFNVSGAFKEHTLLIEGYSVKCPNDLPNPVLVNGTFKVVSHIYPASPGVSFCQLDVSFSSNTAGGAWGVNGWSGRNSKAIHTISIDPSS